MSEGTRPLWGFEEMSEADFRTILSFGVVSMVRSRWEFISEDSIREWLEAVSFRDERANFRKVPDGWKKVWAFVGSASNPGLFKLTYLGEQMHKKIAEIDRFEKEEAGARAEYERLKAKFGNT